MTPEERKAVADEARWEARVENLEVEVRTIKGSMIWFTRAIWGGVAYLGMKLFDFLASGGTLR
jgi:hypothetical protein